MNEKLKSSVNYYFRFDERDDIEEIKAEVFSIIIFVGHNFSLLSKCEQ